MKELPADFVDLLTTLADAEVDFVIVGGYAVAFHGYSRATKDIDILVRADTVNAKKLYGALVTFGAPLEQFEVSEDDFSNYGGVLQLGVPPQRIDIINRISGVTYDEATRDSELFDLGGRSIRVIGLKALIKNKIATGRDHDLLDVRSLSRVKR